MFKYCMLFLFALFSTQSWANDYVLKIKNQTSYDLHYLFVSSINSTDWENDLLDEDEILEQDSQLNLTLTDYDESYFDVRAIDENGDLYYRYRVKADEQSVVFSSNDRIINNSPTKSYISLK